MLEFVTVDQLVGIAIVLAFYYIYQEITYKKKLFTKNVKEEYHKILHSEEYKVKKQY